MLLANIALALALLINAVFISEPEKFTALPSILLLATLFRLSVNISTTRQLLSTGDAPDIIIAFGEFVVKGNMVVGLVVFSIITLVQFIVIAKGAERVAEVSARFTLDAMPGRQMSIDADLRAGILTMQDARQKRIELQRESKLYGSLDGAMKFVKGDAIAGLLITIINITAGLYVGVMQQQLSAADAAHKYTLFTIGDGLVSQIPALLVAVAAGISVTQVSGQGSSYLSRDVFAQIARDPRALAITGVVLSVLALVPGFPSLPFLCAGVGLMAVAGKKNRALRRVHPRAPDATFRPKIYSGLVVRLSVLATAKLQGEQMIPKSISEMRNDFFEKTGVLIPDVQFDVDQRSPGWRAELFVHGEWRAAVAEQAGASTVAVVSMVREFVTHNLVTLLDDTHTRSLLELHQAHCEDLVNSIIPQHVTVTTLTGLLHNLVAEQVSIRDFRTVLQTLANCYLAPVQKPFYAGSNTAKHIHSLYEASDKSSTKQLDLLALVRVSLGYVITRQLADAKDELSVWLFAPELDQMLSEHQANNLPLPPQLITTVLDRVKECRAEDRDQRTVVVSSSGVRAMLSQILRAELKDISVISIEEVTDAVRLKVKGELSVDSLTEQGILRDRELSHAIN